MSFRFNCIYMPKTLICNTKLISQDSPHDVNCKRIGFILKITQNRSMKRSFTNSSKSSDYSLINFLYWREKIKMKANASTLGFKMQSAALYISTTSCQLKANLMFWKSWHYLKAWL